MTVLWVALGAAVGAPARYLTDRAVQIPLPMKDHRDVVPGGRFAGPVPDLPQGGQCLLVVGQGLPPVPEQSARSLVAVP